MFEGVLLQVVVWPNTGEVKAVKTARIVKEDLSLRRAVMTRYTLAYVQDLSFSMPVYSCYAIMLHDLIIILKITCQISFMQSALSSTLPAETWEVTAADAPPLPLGERQQNGGESLR
ncbi:MAG: hypothetical protein HPY61_13810 [Methanotrichaceae archaeon]|nr:hypothetical protein [Methanotrichaceae archaeon]